MEVGKAITSITIFEEEIMFKYMHCNASMAVKNIYTNIYIFVSF